MPPQMLATMSVLRLKRERELFAEVGDGMKG